MRTPSEIVSQMEFQSLPRCPAGARGDDREVRKRLTTASMWTGSGERHWRDGHCQAAWEHLNVAQQHALSVACFTQGLSHERQRRLAKRYGAIQKRLTKLHWKLVGSCLRRKPRWTGNEIIWIAAGKPTLNGALGKTTPHDLRRVAKIAKHQGWRVARTQRGHYQFCPPTGADCVITSGTPGTQGSIRNAIAQLRRSGLEI